MQTDGSTCQQNFPFELHSFICIFCHVSENDFDWETYCRKHKAVAAPKECFTQVCKVVLWFKLIDITFCVYLIMMNFTWFDNNPCYIRLTYSNKYFLQIYFIVALTHYTVLVTSAKVFAQHLKIHCISILFVILFNNRSESKWLPFMWGFKTYVRKLCSSIQMNLNLNGKRNCKIIFVN